ncbi:MAG: hypothetical protein EOM18_06090 [Clostridia bacterium]|nr:hypothetical protein [Clostridia bacterium]
MNKNGKIEDSLDFKKYEEDFEEMMQEMKDDPDYEKCKIPDDWDKEFRKAIDETLEKKQKEKRIRFLKRLGVAAAVIVAVMVGANYSMEAVQGESLLEVLQSTFSSKGNQYVKYGTEKDMSVTNEINQDEIYVEADSLDKVYQMIREELKMPMIQATYVPEEYKVAEAKYDKNYNLLNIKLEKGTNYIYLSQQRVDDYSIGVVTEEEPYGMVDNIPLQQKILIYESKQDGDFAFSVKVNQEIMALRGNISLEECENIAKGLVFE